MIKKNILVISDDLNTARSLAFILEAAQYDILLISLLGEFLAEMALWQSGQKQLSLMVLDLEMPGITESGWVEAIERVHGQVPILAMTGFPHSRNSMTGHFKKVDGYLEKPFDARRLLNKVRQIVDGRPRRSTRKAKRV